MSKLIIGINPGISNKDYHSDCEFFSSSDYKTLLKNPHEFYENKILRVKKEEEKKDHYSEGSFVHTLILEPHLANVEYAVYPGLVRRGREYEEFKSKNPDKVILTKAQYSKCLAHERAYKNNPIAMDIIKGTESEQTIVQNYCGIPTKVRCDAINVEKGIIVDVKTSGFPVDLESFKETVKKFDYDLSAALYAEVASQHYGKQFDFLWLVIGKQESDCQVYKMSQKTRNLGLSRIMKANQIYRQCVATNNWPKVVEIKHEVQHEIQEI